MKYRLDQLVDLPKRVDINYPPEEDYGISNYNLSYNHNLNDCENIVVEVNQEKIIKIIERIKWENSSILLKREIDSNAIPKKIAQAIAENLPDILGKKRNEC